MAAMHLSGRECELYVDVLLLSSLPKPEKIIFSQKRDNNKFSLKGDIRYNYVFCHTFTCPNLLKLMYIILLVLFKTA